MVALNRRSCLKRFQGLAEMAVPILWWGGIHDGPKVLGGQGSSNSAKARGRTLSHEETLRWIAEHRAWRRARKTKPIWTRPVEAEEVGKAFQTADHAVEK